MREIEEIERLACVCAEKRRDLGYRERVEIERAILNSASLVARRYCSMDLTGFSMRAHDVVEEVLAREGCDPGARTTIRMAFELSAALGKLCSANPYVQKEMSSTIGGSTVNGFALFARRMMAYRQLLALLE